MGLPIGYSKNNPTYTSWRSMRERCRSKESYKHIKICHSWQTSFESFLCDMGERPEGTTLDRIDVTGHYCKENCRWATLSRQQRNKINTPYLIVEGLVVPARDVADLLNIRPNAMKAYIAVCRKLKEQYGIIPDIKDRSTCTG